MARNAVTDMFTLKILDTDTDTRTGGGHRGVPIDAQLRIDVDFLKQTVRPGGAYHVNFWYAIGSPAATDDFEIEWMRGNVLAGDAQTPSWSFTPTAPVTATEALRWFRASVSGRMPQETGRYRGTIKMNQPDPP